MAQDHLIRWGKDAFENGMSLTHIENYLLKRGMKRQESLKALSEITVFEHKVHQELKRMRNRLIIFLTLLLFVIFAAMLFYYGGFFK